MKNILIKYRLIIIVVIPFLFFLISLLVLLPYNKTQPAPIQIPNPTGIPDFLLRPSPDNIKEEGEDSVEERPGRLSKDALPDKTFKYNFKSSINGRPNVIIARNEYTIVFQSMVTNPRFPVKITDYTDIDGPAKWVFKGSVFYGPEFQTYIYPEKGLAFIANPKTGEVLEQHLFDSMKVEEYIKKYGEDIPAQP
jgi:hypothetical protein